MAKWILRIFGSIAIIAGFFALAIGFESSTLDKTTYLLGLVPISAGMILLGAPLVGFAYVIELLEKIERNTRPPNQWPGSR